MSEHQYYEFQAIDRTLDRAAQEALRSISSRARITAMSFTNYYEWGDFKGDPSKLMEQWFDLHLYLANWGTRRLMMRLPKRLVCRADIDPFLREIDWVRVWNSGNNLIVDIHHDEAEPDDEWDDGSGRLATLAPLRSDVLSGDFRLFYLLWLTAVQEHLVADDAVEPLAGIGPLTGALHGFAQFFGVDPDLVQAAGERGADVAATSKDDLREMLAAVPEGEKIELLQRVVEGDNHVAAELRRRLLKEHAVSAAPRTVATLRMRALEIGKTRESAAAEWKEAERRRQAEEAERACRAGLKALRQRGEGVWREIEDEIERRSAAGYDRAASLLSDLQVLALEEGGQNDFLGRLASIRARHERKGKFIERLEGLGRSNDERAA
ncbi:MAG TPA: hypothetical protein VHX61_03830 [Rhizomicrobium sp.]|nr:hypothetical protein [Rhizomicrobium sp.]